MDTHTDLVWLALRVSNQTNRLGRREVRTPGRMDTKSEGDNMVSVLWINDGFPGQTPSQPSPLRQGVGVRSLLPGAGCHGWEPGAWGGRVLDKRGSGRYEWSRQRSKGFGELL